MAKNDKYVADLILKIVGKQTGEISKVDYKPQKPVFDHNKQEGETVLERKSPESQGISSADITWLFNELTHTNKCEMHKIMVLRNGYVIGECAYKPYDMDMWHVTHSMCKSITGMAIGFMISEGKLTLETKISDVFNSKKSIFSFFKQSDITVYHLLTMTSGVDYNETGAISGNDWVKRFMESSSKYIPGLQFDYNSMNSYILSALVSEITGENLVEYLKPRLFDPLGIKRIFWEVCPSNIIKGGWGLFMRIEDMAKLGQLYLNNGMWDGKQILPENWVAESTTPRVATQKSGTPYYGYQLWLSDSRNGAYTFNGMLGQNVFCFPDVNMVICTNAGNSDIFQAGCMNDVIGDFMHNIVISDDLLADKAFNSDVVLLKAACKHFNGRTTDFPSIMHGGWNKGMTSFNTGSSCRKNKAVINRPSRNRSSIYLEEKSRLSSRAKRLIFNALDDKIYDLDITSVGVFPLLMQVFHNNFTDGIRSIGFKKTPNGQLYMDLYEGDQVYHLLCNFDQGKQTSFVNVHGEVYEVCVSSVCKTDEYDRLVLRNEVYFLEEAVGRIINVYLDMASGAKEIEVCFDETPGKSLIIDCLDMVTGDNDSFSISSFVMNKITEYGAMDVVKQTIMDTISPVAHGYEHVDVSQVVDNSESPYLLKGETE